MFQYPDFRIFGKPPYEIAVVHGGPGAPGELEPLAVGLSEICGLLEPLQKQTSIEGQLIELENILNKNCRSPVILIGWSWGAMLSFIFTARFPKLVKKLILINSGPFDPVYAKNIMPSRLSRLPEELKMEFLGLIGKLEATEGEEQSEILKKFAKIIFQADAFNPIVEASQPLEYQYEVYKKVFGEAMKWRSCGRLLACGKSIAIPVVAIHGVYDPHPFQGVKDPLSQVLKNFRFILLERCGHYPWYEREAKENFYKILKKEILSVAKIG